MNYSTSFKSLKDEVSPEEWQARVDLAACYRLVDAYGMTDLIYNHITLRIPGTEHLLINLYGLLYKEITASSLVKITLDGEIVQKQDTDYGINIVGGDISDANEFPYFGTSLIYPSADCVVCRRCESSLTCLSYS